MNTTKIDKNHITIEGRHFKPNDILEIKPHIRGTVVIFYSGKGFFVIEKKGIINKLFIELQKYGYYNFIFLKDRIINLSYINIKEVLPTKNKFHSKDDMIFNVNYDFCIKFNDFYSDIIKCSTHYELNNLKTQFFEMLNNYFNTKNDTVEHC